MLPSSSFSSFSSSSLLLLLLGCWAAAAEPECRDPVLCQHHHSEAVLHQAWGDVMDALPPKGGFLPGLRSPCWRDENKVAHCLPGFIVAGIAKCGTTDVFRRLKMHPDIQGSRIKEPHWLTRAGQKPTGSRYALSKYISMWDGTAEDTIRGNKYTFEASASTFWDRGDRNLRNANVLLPEALAKFLPDIKILVIFREPKSRLWSDFKYFTHQDALVSPEEFHQRVTTLTQGFTQCLTEHAKIECVYNASFQRTNPRIALSMYAEYVKVWSRYFSPKQLMILSSEQVLTEPKRVYTQIFEFLGLRPLPENLWPLILDPGTHANTNHKHSDIHMLPESVQVLDDFFAPFNHELTELAHNSDQYVTVVK